MRCCLALALVAPLGAGIGVLQGPPRGPLTAAMALFMGLAALGSWWLTGRRQQLATGIHVLCTAVTLAVVGGCFLSGRAAMAAFMLFVPLSVATLHHRPRRILVDFSLVFGGAALMAAFLEPIDPVLFPALFVMLTLVGLVAYFSSRVNHLNQIDILRANEELRRVNAELAETTRRAEAASEAKSLFLATMSHELRTPLNAVLGYTELVQDCLADDGPLDRQEAHDDLEQARSAARRLLTQVNRVLDLSRLEAGTDVVCVPTALDEVARRAVARHREAGEERGLRLELTVDPGGATEVCTDPDRLARLLDDLIDNAIRFTPAGSVTLHVGGDVDQGVVEVVDTGVGIAPEQIERVFQPFTQADGSFTRQVDGVGLGLTLCRRLAHSMGAELALISEEGVGTTARITLPLSPP